MRKILLLLFISLFCLCTENPSNAGGGVDVETNGGRVAGVVIDSSGKSCGNVNVTLLPAGHTPFSNDTILTLSTDNSGKFVFDSVDSGRYNLEATIADTKQRALRLNILVRKDTIQLTPVSLKESGVLSIPVQNPDLIQNGSIYIAGTTFKTSATVTDSRIILDGLPCGLIPPVMFKSNLPGSTPVKLTDSVVVTSAKPETALPDSFFKHWPFAVKLRYSNSIGIQSTSSVIKNMPIFFRLNRTNFDHSTIQEAFNFIIVNSMGKVLPSELERVDTDTSSAIWFQPPEVNVADTSQYFTLYWGRIDTTTLSVSSKVFSPENGYLSVWHLGTSAPDTNNLKVYKDATVNANDGDDFVKGTDLSGSITGSEYFDGKSDRIVINNVKSVNPATGTFTLSLWFFSDTIQNATLMSWKYKVNNTDYHLTANISSDGTLNVSMNETSVVKIAYGENKKWHQLLLTRNISEVVDCYIDGNLASSGSLPDQIGSESNGRITLGAIADTNDIRSAFIGRLDEVRIENTFKTADHVKVIYTNQNTGFIEAKRIR